MNEEYMMRGDANDKFKYFPEDVQKIERYKLNFQNEIMAFLSGAPESVRNIYISGLLEITNTMAHLLNKYFPSLSFLLLKTIKKIDRRCLKNFRNLEIFVSWIGNIIEVPSNLKVCMVIDDYGDHFYKRSEFESSSKYYRELDQFTKEYTYHGSIEGKVFFRHFHEYNKLKSYLRIITEHNSVFLIN
uniref:RAP domain-containing protein n=1 Tax=Strongyloides papillosus TaxID=174720 RepID=A0A0N5C0T8_STREA